MPNENNPKNVYQIPETEFSAELSEKRADYIDYIYADDDKSKIEVSIDQPSQSRELNDSDTSLKQKDDIKLDNPSYNEFYRETAERNVSKEAAEVLEIAKDLEAARSEFIVNGNSLDTVKKGLISAIFGSNSSRKPLTLKDLKNEESAIGSTIFGSDPGTRTEFFNDNLKSWFFYQEVADKKGNKDSVTLHYEIHPDGILRIKNNEINGCVIDGEELDNFVTSTRMYHTLVMNKIYKKKPYSDKLAA